MTSMFKSKGNIKLPEAPEPPSWEMMKEDIENASKNDILFSLRTKHENSLSLEGVNGTLNEDLMASKNVTDVSSEDIFALTMNYVQQKERFDNLLSDYDIRRENLNEICEELRGTVENVKKQALTAISK